KREQAIELASTINDPFARDKVAEAFDKYMVGGRKGGTKISQPLEREDVHVAQPTPVRDFLRELANSDALSAIAAPLQALGLRASSEPMRGFGVGPGGSIVAVKKESVDRGRK